MNYNYNISVGRLESSEKDIFVALLRGDQIFFNDVDNQNILTFLLFCQRTGFISYNGSREYRGDVARFISKHSFVMSVSSPSSYKQFGVNKGDTIVITSNLFLINTVASERANQPKEIYLWSDILLHDSDLKTLGFTHTADRLRSLFEV